MKKCDDGDKEDELTKKFHELRKIYKTKIKQYYSAYISNDEKNGK